MTKPVLTVRGEGLVRGAAHAVLVAAVRGRGDQGGPWGEAVLGEFAMTRGGWESVRWAAGGLRTVWQERRERVRQLPRYERRGRRVAVAAVLMVLLAVPIRMFVLSALYVPSGSMEPTLQVGDRWMIDKMSWRITGIDRGDIITYTAANEPGTTPAKSTRVQRVIGLPGDTIECRDQQIFRNGVVLDDRWSPPKGVEPPVPELECTPVTVPSDSLYLVGDHWVVSQDSRQSGPVPMDDVESRLLFRFWPLPNQRGLPDGLPAASGWPRFG